MGDLAGHAFHTFPCNPPGGSFLNPGPCKCGKTYEQNEADAVLAEAVAALTRAYGAPPRVSTHWAVAFGSAGINDGVGLVELYDDEDDARGHLRLYEDGSVVKRTVIALPWETAPDTTTNKGRTR